MKKRKLTFGLLAMGFALLSQSAAAQEVCGTARLVSNQPAGTPITLRVNNNYYGVVVDWGDGNPVTYNDRTKAVREITGKVAMTGNNVSHSHHKTKRKFSPNLKNKRFTIIQ